VADRNVMQDKEKFFQIFKNVSFMYQLDSSTGRALEQRSEGTRIEPVVFYDFLSFDFLIPN